MRNVRQHRPTIEGEVHVLEREFPGSTKRIVAGGNRGGEREQALHFHHVRARVLQSQRPVDHVEERDEVTEREREREHVAFRRRARDAHARAGHQRDGESEVDVEERDRTERDRRDRRFEGRDVEFFERPREAPRALGRPAEGAQQRDRIDVFEEARRAFRARAGEDGRRARADRARLPQVARRDRQQQERDERDAPVERGDHGEGCERGDRAPEHLIEPAGQCFAGVVEARGEERDRAARVEPRNLVRRNLAQAFDRLDARTFGARGEPVAHQSRGRRAEHELQEQRARDGNGEPAHFGGRRGVR